MERVIERVDFQIPMQPKALRVCAYARVSSGKDAMLHSLSAQVSYYNSLIQSHADWLYCGVFSDEAITGTKSQRDGFQRMLASCRAGEIDLVITKSISRFARNTVTLLQTVRELKSLGVDVFFEEQNIHTMSADGELMLNFFRGLPKELEEAALLDGAGHLSVLLRVYVPLSKPSIATVTLFSMVGHWNSWFDGMIYLRDDTLQPLATLLHNMVSRTTLNVIMETTDISVIEQLLTVTNESLKSAQLFIGMLPILCVYPFIQKYFTKGLVIGSVKG